MSLEVQGHTFHSSYPIQCIHDICFSMQVYDKLSKVIQANINLTFPHLNSLNLKEVDCHCKTLSITMRHFGIMRPGEGV